ncbi:MAG: hypothetical protein JNM98_08580 [Rhodocyclaceae bacterium]|nr:hypothetical protein [Rhodocyclaceae bacterium]
MPKHIKALAVAVAGALAVSGAAHAGTACDLLTEQDAAKLMGAALPENLKSDTPPTAQNGDDHTMVCGWFPKGYKLATADGPPERAIQLTVHAMKSAAAAKGLHDASNEGAREIAKMMPGGSKFTPVKDLGPEASLEQSDIAGVQIATLRFVKGAHAVQIQAWRKDAAPAAGAVAAGKQIAGKF